MDLLPRAKELYRMEGLSGLLRGVFRFVYWNLGILALRRRIEYRRHAGSETIEIGDTEAQFRIDNYTEFVRFRDIMHERAVLEDLAANLAPGDVFYDIGANVGLYSCIAALQKDISVVAFEPHPKNVERLRENARYNDVDPQILPLALGAETGTAKLTVDENRPGAGEHTLAPSAAGETIDVRIRTARELIERGEIPLPTVVKIDVGGAELNVLDGFGRALRDCRIVYCEVHPDRIPEFGGDVKRITTTLEANGFEVAELVDRKNESLLRGKKATER